MGYRNDKLICVCLNFGFLCCGVVGSGKTDGEDDAMKRLLEKLIAWIKDAFEGVPVPSPEDSGDATTDPTPQEPSSPSLQDIKWLGKNYSGAVEDMELVAATISNSQHSFSPAAPASWPIKTVKVPVQGIVCLFYDRDGKIVGGKYDWCRPNQKSKGLENVHGGYGGHSMPTKGTPCYTMLVSVDEKKRSNLLETQWK
jgi:hypothetical protein